MIQASSANAYGARVQSSVPCQGADISDEHQVDVTRQQLSHSGVAPVDPALAVQVSRKDVGCKRLGCPGTGTKK